MYNNNRSYKLVWSLDISLLRWNRRINWDNKMIYRQLQFFSLSFFLSSMDSSPVIPLCPRDNIFERRRTRPQMETKKIMWLMTKSFYSKFFLQKTNKLYWLYSLLSALLCLSSPSLPNHSFRSPRSFLLYSEEPLLCLFQWSITPRIYLDIFNIKAKPIWLVKITDFSLMLMKEKPYLKSWKWWSKDTDSFEFDPLICFFFFFFSLWVLHAWSIWLPVLFCNLCVRDLIQYCWIQVGWNRRCVLDGTLSPPINQQIVLLLPFIISFFPLIMH